MGKKQRVSASMREKLDWNRRNPQGGHSFYVRVEKINTFIQSNGYQFWIGFTGRSQMVDRFAFRDELGKWFYFNSFAEAMNFIIPKVERGNLVAEQQREIKGETIKVEIEPRELDQFKEFAKRSGKDIETCIKEFAFERMNQLNKAADDIMKEIESN